MLFFFFSSRSRHTSSKRDWSSDVCSSDLGLEQSMRTAIGIARPGGAVGRVRVPQDEAMPASRPAFYDNLTVSGGPAPVRAYIQELLPDVLEGRIEPGRVFDRVASLD